MRTTWRDLSTLKNAGYPVSSPSDQACKLYDAALTQMYGWYNDPQLGGLEGTVNAMLEADPNFVMGHVLSVSRFFGAKVDPSFKKTLLKLASLRNISEVERMHLEAAFAWSSGSYRDAVNIWDQILAECSQDYLSLRMVYLADFSTGREEHRHHTLERINPLLRTDDPINPYVDGMRAFAFCEVNNPVAGKPLAQRGLEKQPRDIWATHALSHIHNSMGSFEEGASLLQQTSGLWGNVDGALTCHVYWHQALNHVALNQTEDALGVYDDHVVPLITKDNILSLIDAASFLFRLKVRGLDLKDRWKVLLRSVEPHIEDRNHPFQDIHYFITSIFADSADGAKILRSFSEQDFREFRQLIPILPSIYQAIEDFAQGNYGSAVDLIYPHMDRLVHFGGSRAQRDLFDQLLIFSSLKSDRPRHRKIARLLLHQRESHYKQHPDLKLLQNQLMAFHIDE